MTLTVYVKFIVPARLNPTQVYRPLSASRTGANRNVDTPLTSSSTGSILAADILLPSLYHEISGVGLPAILQVRRTVLPTYGDTTDFISSISRNAGGSNGIYNLIDKTGYWNNICIITIMKKEVSNLLLNSFFKTLTRQFSFSYY